MPEITVVTATVNRPGLKKAVASVQAQTLRPAKHCILFQQLMRSPVIDLPKPESVPIIMKWIPPPQPHLVDAYIMAEQMADTPLIAMLDDDCWWEPAHLASLYKLMVESGADFVWSSSIIHDDATGEERMRKNDPVPAFMHIDTNEILYRRDCVKNWGTFRMEDHRGIDGKRIERWVGNGAVYAHSNFYTCHYGWRDIPEF